MKPAGSAGRVSRAGRANAKRSTTTVQTIVGSSWKRSFMELEGGQMTAALPTMPQRPKASRTDSWKSSRKPVDQPDRFLGRTARMVACPTPSREKYITWAMNLHLLQSHSHKWPSLSYLLGRHETINSNPRADRTGTINAPRKTICNNLTNLI